MENWREYEVALRDRGSLTVWVTPEAIAAWHPARTGRPGRSAHYSDLAIETGVMLRLAFARPWRQTEGLLRSVTTLLGLRLDVPDHTTLSRRSAALSLVTALAVPAGPVNVVIDDPKHAFPVGSRYGRKAPESCRSRYWQMRQELPSICLFPFGVEACFL